MSAAVLALIGLFLIFILKVLNVTSTPAKPILYCKDSDFLATLLKFSSVLEEEYIPTKVWGFSGHIQTIIHSVIGRVKCPWPRGDRIELKLSDGSTLTYDLYQPLGSAQDDVLIIVVPGICNTSESVYVRTFVHYAQCHGYRLAVLNHLGVLASVPLTSPRLFTYGYTGDLEAMAAHVCDKYQRSAAVIVGYSMGGNLITKYLGQTDRPRPPNLIGGISICQGYDAIEGTKWLLQWQNIRRLYLYVMTEAMKAIVLRNRRVLLSDDAKRRYGLVEKEIISAATLPEFDNAYTRKIYNFGSVEEMYQWSSSQNYFSGIKLPMVFINSLDDPLVPDDLLKGVRDFAGNSSKVAYIEMRHGGHLGFFEGGYMYPHPVAWLDRALISIVGSLIAFRHSA